MDIADNIFSDSSAGAASPVANLTGQSTSSQRAPPISPHALSDQRPRPELVNKFEAGTGEVTGVAQMPGRDGIITVSSDRSVRVWLLRDSGQYWPSVCNYMGGAATALRYSHQHRKVFVGLDNGMISELYLSEDCNRLDHIRDYSAHQGRVATIYYSSQQKWLLSGGRDKYFQFHCVSDGRRLGGYLCNSSCTALDYDEEAKYAFVGDYSGQICVLKLDQQSGVQFINCLKGHDGSIQTLSWDGQRGWLYSGSYDSCVFVWDIGGRKGTVYELHGHRYKVTSVRLLASVERLLSVSEDGTLVLWNMKAERAETSEWSQSDSCQLCSRPFFWNFKAMYDQKQIGLRQHHCRKCGRAVCAGCSPKKVALPYRGHELPVRICEECSIKIDPEETKSLASFQDLKQNVTCLSIDETRRIMATVGPDHIVKIWNVKSIL